MSSPFIRSPLDLAQQQIAQVHQSSVSINNDSRAASRHNTIKLLFTKHHSSKRLTPLNQELVSWKSNHRPVSHGNISICFLPRCHGAWSFDFSGVLVRRCPGSRLPPLQFNLVIYRLISERNGLATGSLGHLPLLELPSQPWKADHWSGGGLDGIGELTPPPWSSCLGGEIFGELKLCVKSWRSTTSMLTMSASFWGISVAKGIYDLLFTLG